MLMTSSPKGSCPRKASSRTDLQCLRTQSLGLVAAFVSGRPLSLFVHPIHVISGPGRFASEAFVWTAVVSILATFRITKAKDADGKEIDVKKQFTTGLAVYVIMGLPSQLKLTVHIFQAAG